MDSIKFEAYSSSDWHPSNVVEGQVIGPAFDVRIHHTRWAERGESVFEPSMSFIEMFLSASKKVKGTYVRAAEPSDYASLGNIVFIPERTAFYYSWVPGDQRCVSCLFDIRALCQRAAIDWRWPNFDLQKALNIRNDYIRIGLQRIAEELLSPGFASTQQVECSLLFVALELRRYFEDDAHRAPSTNGKLNAKQITTLRSMLIDSPGAPPSIGELAAACKMGGRQLALYYRRTTGVTLRSFIAAARLERAKMLLLASRICMKQIAYDAGFSSSAAFAAAFRRCTGVTPTEFRARRGCGELH